MPFLMVRALSPHLINDSTDRTGKRAHSDDWTAGQMVDGPLMAGPMMLGLLADD